MDDEAALAGLCAALAGLRRGGSPLVLVHGGGKDINRHLAWLNEEPVFKDGLRVTGPAALKVVEMTLSGYVNKKLVGLLNAGGAAAAGLSGVDGPTFLCEPLAAELGLVGRIVEVRTGLVTTLLAGGFLPVVSPISVDRAQSHYNVNADDAASALAAGLQAAKLVFVSDVEGVRDAAGTRLLFLDGPAIEALIRDGVASGGMIPKLRSCLAAVGQGIGQVEICKWSDARAFAAQIEGSMNSGTIIR
jgi:acetylglutamate kinase